MEFKVGEIAVVCNVGRTPDWNGREIEIIGPLEMRRCTSYCVEPAYLVDAPWLPDRRKHPWVAQPRFLRKRPQPQDWEKLATPADVPEEVAV